MFTIAQIIIVCAWLEAQGFYFVPTMMWYMSRCYLLTGVGRAH